MKKRFLVTILRGDDLVFWVVVESPNVESKYFLAVWDAGFKPAVGDIVTWSFLASRLGI